MLSDFAFEFDFADGLPFFEFENPEVDAISVPALRVFSRPLLVSCLRETTSRNLVTGCTLDICTFEYWHASYFALHHVQLLTGMSG